MKSLARHLVHQRKVIASLTGVALGALLRPPRRVGSGTLPGSEHHAELPPPPAALVRDYVIHVGGIAETYAATIPPHFFPHWGMPLAAETLRGLPYPLLRVVNAGCRLEMNAPLVAGEPLRVSARLERVDDDGQRALLHQRIVTGQRSCPEALVAHVYAVVPLARGDASMPKQAAEKPRVPPEAERIDTLTLGRNAGLDFALLTGDFNPVHWFRPYARALGHPGTVLHGFATMARVYEALARLFPAGRIDTLDVRFLRPLVLPASVGVYRHGEALFVGARGEPAFLTGSYVARDDPSAGSAFAVRGERPSVTVRTKLGIAS